jgi:hypothetical protein
MMVEAIGVLAAPAKTATKPIPASIEKGMQQRRERIADGRPDVEERCDFATLEAGAQRGHRKDHLAQEIPGASGCWKASTITGMPRPM